MTVTFQCRCGAHFDVLSKSKNTNSFTCPSCGKPLPGKSSDCAKEMIAAYNRLVEEIHAAELYEFKIT